VRFVEEKMTENPVENTAKQPKTGGQAVIEGVMMHSPVSTAVAVRTPEGNILVRILEIDLLKNKSKVWGKPVFRGAATLIDTMRLGMASLNWSAEIAEGDKDEKESRWNEFLGFISQMAAFAIAIGLFALLPLWGSVWILESISEPSTGIQFAIHILAGIFRIIVFLGYLISISFLKDVKRLFTYHGAEHQTIHAYEKGLEPLAESALEESPLHQRCGTSFLLLVMVCSIIFYGIFDSVVILISGENPAPIIRVLYHLPLIPLVMGFSYELLRLADKNLETSALARAVTHPGLLMQKLTTRKAGLEEIEVAVASLRVSLKQNPGPGVTILPTSDEESEEKNEI